MRGNYLIFYCFLQLLSLYSVDSERIKNKIYQKIEGTAACFRRMNGTHQIGCTSSEKGNVGVVHHVDDIGDLDWLLQKGPHSPYAVLLNADNFNRENLMRMKNSGKVNGVMVISLNGSSVPDIPESFSPDTSCPLNEYGMYAGGSYEGCPDVKWNSVGNGLMFEDYNFPIIVLTNKTEVDFVINNCYKKFNEPLSGNTPREFPLCAVQMKDRMDGAKDSETCIRRTRHQLNLNPDSYCDPLGDQNVFATVKAVDKNSEYPQDSVIVAAARMDSFSMFDGLYPSADNHVTGIVGLLAVAEVLGRFKEKFTNTSKDIAFMFFQGEAFDYIGSGRMVYEMERNNFPLSQYTDLHSISLAHLSHFVEVNQLAYRDDGSLWIHTDPVSTGNQSVDNQVQEMVKKLVSIGQSVDSPVSQADQSKPLPPASVQSFLKKRPIPSVVITDHKAEFTNKYYNSRFDVASLINISYEGVNETDRYDHVTEQAVALTKVSTMIAQFLFTLATGENATADMVASNKTVTNLLYCFLVSPKGCDLFQQVLTASDAGDLSETPYPFYVGVDRQTNHVTTLTQKVLGLFLGEVLEDVVEEDNCSQSKQHSTTYQYIWMQGPLNNGSRTNQCVKTTANTSEAMSIAFEYDVYENYDWKSREYSTWTESSWATDAIQMKLFLIPSKQFEVGILVAGILVLVVSLLGSFLVDKRVNYLFTPPNESSDPATSAAT